jgi:hypothetical protein
MKKNALHLLLVLLAVVLASLSCVTSPGNTPPWLAGDQEAQNLIQSACDGTSALRVTGEITLQETNQFGTRACEYDLKVTNTNPDTPVRFYIYQHDADGYQHTEKRHWMGNVLVAPGATQTWHGSIYIYSDKDADGPLMTIGEKIAGVFDTPECADERQDEKYFEAVAFPLESACPLE